MTVPQRLLAVPVLAGVMYLSVVAAGMSGFDPGVWVLYVVLFLVWHLLMHRQEVPVWVVIPVHAMVAAGFLWLGALIGGSVGGGPPPLAALAVGVVALVAARLVRLPPEEAEAITALADEARAKLEAAAPRAEPGPTPADDALPDPEPDEMPDDAVDATLADIFAALDALPADAPRHHDLVAAITTAIRPVPLRDLVSALFTRARATPCTRDLLAVTVLLTDPYVAHAGLGNGDAEAAFHLIRAAGDEAALAHWAMQTEAVLDLVPDLWPDLPDDALLQEAAAEAPAARQALLALVARRAADPERPAP